MSDFIFMRKIWKALALLVILALPAFLLTGCQNQAQTNQQANKVTAENPQKTVNQQEQAQTNVNQANQTNEDQELIELLNALDEDNNSNTTQ